MTYSMLFVFSIMFTKAFSTILACILWLQKTEAHAEPPQKGGGMGRGVIVRVDVGDMKIREAQEA